MMLNAQWLDTFFVLCEAGHFTKAAGRLNITQPGYRNGPCEMSDLGGFSSNDPADVCPFHAER